jgi:hypothetical protein
MVNGTHSADVGLVSDAGPAREGARNGGDMQASRSFLVLNNSRRSPQPLPIGRVSSFRDLSISGQARKCAGVAGGRSVALRLIFGVTRGDSWGRLKVTLDAMFGALIPPQRPGRGLAVQRWERDFAPDSLSKLDDDSAASLRQAMKEISSGWKLGRVLIYDTIIIWAVDKAGDIWFAMEELVLNDMPTGRPKHQRLELTSVYPKLGHPALVNCERARIAGEIYFDTGDDPPLWRINNNSGRYGRVPSRVPAHLNNVADRFRGFGIDLTPHFIRA